MKMTDRATQSALSILSAAHFHVKPSIFVSAWVTLAFMSCLFAISASANFPPVIDVDDINGEVGRTVRGESYSFGNTINGIGDVNGDGLPDVAFADPFISDNDTSATGRVYVLFGRDGGILSDIDLSAFEAADGFVLSGRFQLGESVSGAGDLNHDGIDDFVISESRINAGLTRNGRVFVIFGRNTSVDGDFPVSINLSTDLTETLGFEIRGARTDETAGAAVSDAGDINNDGIDDLIIGAPRDSVSKPESPGRAYVVYGRDTSISGAFPLVLELSSLTSSLGFVFEGLDVGDGTGARVSAAGDLNNDDVDDVIVSTNRQSLAYVVFGRNSQQGVSFPEQVFATNLDGTNGFSINGEGIDAVADAGDVNNDGIDDIIIGTSAGTSRAYVVFGIDVATVGPFPTVFSVTDLNGENGFTIYPNGPSTPLGDSVGKSVAGIGDINNDGVDDLGLTNGYSGGELSYIVFGRDTLVEEPFPAPIFLDGLDGDNGFIIDGTTDSLSARLGPRIAAAGDVNNDGIADVILGAPRVFSGSDDQLTGTGYIVYGRSADVLRISSIANPKSFGDSKEPITIEFLVKNTSPIEQTSVMVTEPTLGSICTIDSLRPGLETTCTARYITTEKDFSTGKVEFIPIVSSDQTPGIVGSTLSIVRRYPLSLVVESRQISFGAVDEPLTIDVILDNLGDQVLTNVIVSGPRLGSPLCVIGSLWPDKRAVCTGVHFVSLSELIASKITFRVTTTSDQITEPSTASLTVTGGLNISSVATPNHYSQAGETLIVDVDIKNLGPVAVHSLRVSEKRLGEPLCIVPILSPGFIARCTGVYTVNDEDVTEGAVSFTIAVEDDRFPYGVTSLAVPFRAPGTECVGDGRYEDQGDGTVLDCVTGLFWLQDALCLGADTWLAAQSTAAALADGQCGLSDGSVPGDWRLATLSEWKATIADAVTLGCVLDINNGAEGTKVPSLTNDAGTDCLINGPTSFNINGEVFFWTSTGTDDTEAFIADLLFGSGALVSSDGREANLIWPVRAR